MIYCFLLVYFIRELKLLFFLPCHTNILLTKSNFLHVFNPKIGLLSKSMTIRFFLLYHQQLLYQKDLIYFYRIGTTNFIFVYSSFGFLPSIFPTYSVQWHLLARQYLICMRYGTLLWLCSVSTHSDFSHLLIESKNISWSSVVSSQLWTSDFLCFVLQCHFYMDYSPAHF